MSNAAEQTETALLSFVSRIESLLNDRDALSADIKQVKAI